MQRGRDFGRGPRTLVPRLGVYLLQQGEIKREQELRRARGWGNHSPRVRHHPAAPRRAAELLGDKRVQCAGAPGKPSGKRFSLSLGAGALKASEPWKLGLIIS